MLRGENIICGTTTTGTGTLTLAATPGPPGGVDFDVLARATGIGFANSAAILCTYTIREYTDSTFATVKSMEKGIGTLTLGGSSGIANATLVRTTVQVTATSMNAQPATYNVNAPSAFSIGTAANTLVFIGASAVDIPTYMPYFETSGDNLGVAPPTIVSGTGATGTLTTAQDQYWRFLWNIPMLVKRLTVRVHAVYTGGTSNAYGRIYAINSSGRPGKLLYDFGVLGTLNSSLASVANISSGAAGNGYMLLPGEYFLDLLAIFTGGAGSPTWHVGTTVITGYPNSGAMGTSSMYPNNRGSASSGNSVAPDPANVTSYAVDSNSGPLLFTLAPN